MMSKCRESKLGFIIDNIINKEIEQDHYVKVFK